MKKLLIITLLCAVSLPAAAQGNLLKSLKKGLDAVEKVSKSDAGTIVNEVVNVLTDTTRVDENTVEITTQTTTTTTTTTPGRKDSTLIITPGRTETTIIKGGYSLDERRTNFFTIDDSRLEAIDADLFTPEQYQYSMSVGLKNSRFPISRSYKAIFGNSVREDTAAVNFFFKYSAKAIIVAERGKTPEQERSTIAKNYLLYVIQAFVHENAGNGLYDGSGRRLIPRKVLVEAALGEHLDIDEPTIMSTLSDGSAHMLEYIKLYPPKSTVIDYMGDPRAAAHSFEYRFYDREMALHAFMFSPITLHYEVRTWYDSTADVTFYACFYCTGYDRENMLATIGQKNYDGAKKDFKERCDLDFDEFAMQCLMLDFSKSLKAIPHPNAISEVFFPVSHTWQHDESGGGSRTTSKTTTTKQTITTPKPTKPEPVVYAVSPNSAAIITGMNVVDIAEDARYTYLAGDIEGYSRIFSINKQSGEIAQIYITTLGSDGDRGDVKRMMPDGRGGVYVEFSKVPIMLLKDGVFTTTKLHVRADDAELKFYMPKLKGVMPDGGVLLIENYLGNQNVLVDPDSGAIRATSKEMSFNDQYGLTAISRDGVVWEPGQSQSYSLVSVVGGTPVFTKLDVGYNSPFKGRLVQIIAAPDGGMVAASPFGMHRTMDGAKTWKHVKSIYDYGSFDRVAVGSKSEVWAATNTAQGYSVVRYDAPLTKILHRASTFDVMKDGAPLKLQTAPRILFVDSADNLWVVGGTYGAQAVLLFNPAGIKGYSSLAVQKAVDILY